MDVMSPDGEPTQLAKPRFGISTLFWIVLIVAVFFVARQPIFDSLFSGASNTRVITTSGWIAAHSVSDTDLVEIELIDANHCRVIPKRPGLCLVEFKTDSGFEAYIVSISRMKNVSISRTEIKNRITHLMQDGQTVGDLLSSGHPDRDGGTKPDTSR